MRSLSDAGNKELYAYRFDWDDHRRLIIADFKELIGAAHATEIPLLTGNNKLVGDYGFLIYPRGPSKKFTSKNMMLFWTNFAQMRAEYFYWHCNHATELVEGKTTAELAGFRNLNKSNIFQLIMQELVGDMRQHGLHPNAIQEPIKQRCGELEEAYSKVGQRLGSGNTTSLASNENLSARERALQAAERRRNQSNESKE